MEKRRICVFGGPLGSTAIWEALTLLLPVSFEPIERFAQADGADAIVCLNGSADDTATAATLPRALVSGEGREIVRADARGSTRSLDIAHGRCPASWSFASAQRVLDIASSSVPTTAGTRSLVVAEFLYGSGERSDNRRVISLPSAFRSWSRTSSLSIYALVTSFDCCRSFIFSAKWWATRAGKLRRSAPAYVRRSELAWPVLRLPGFYRRPASGANRALLHVTFAMVPLERGICGPAGLEVIPR